MQYTILHKAMKQFKLKKKITGMMQAILLFY
jgi:hypothetical protein